MLDKCNGLTVDPQSGSVYMVGNSASTTWIFSNITFSMIVMIKVNSTGGLLWGTYANYYESWVCDEAMLTTN
jgi:Ca2+-dependent lipid-binding protein